MKIKDILKIKGSKVWTVKSSQTVREALHFLMNQNIGALLVTEASGTIVGIISERDIIRGCYERGAKIESARVSEFMTRDVIIASPEDEINDIMGVMTEKRIRHIPVMTEGKLDGLVSIGDVVKSLLKDSEHQIKYLKEFMYGSNIEIV